MKRLVGVVVALLAATAPALAQAPSVDLTAKDKPVGHIGLTVRGPAGATLAVSETTGRDRPLADVTLDATGRATVPDAATWRCAVRKRTFRAEGAATDGTPLRSDTKVRTPSCDGRFTVTVRPQRPRAGRPITATLTDGFRLGGFASKLCAGGRCAKLEVPEGERSASARIAAPSAGRGEVTARVGGKQVASAPLTVRRPQHVDLLATGDSMIQIIDGYLESRLSPGNVSVRSDARISTGLSKPFFFNWPEHAVKQVRKPADVTVMFIGANDGFPFDDVQCCGKAWTARYAQVVSRMIATYSRGGDAKVYWCLLPAPRGGDFRRVFVAVNDAIRAAAARHPETTRVVDLAEVFTPGYVYRDELDGRQVRQDDGVHLNTAGASIAADVIIRRMRRDGVL